MHDEDVIAGVETITNQNLIQINSGDVSFHLLQYQLISRMRNCNATKRLSPCVNEYYDRTYGHNANTVFDKKKDMKTAKMGGIERITGTFFSVTEVTTSYIIGFNSLSEITNCTQTCQVTNYITQELFTSQLDFTSDPLLMKFRNTGEPHTGTQSSVLIIKHTKASKIIQHEEVLEYDLATMISDAGGIVGLFIGISFWSIYVDLVGPILKQIRISIQKRAATN